MERGQREWIQGKFCCTIFKVFIIRLYLTRGLSLMKQFFLFSLTLCSHLPKCLSSISLPSSSISLSLPLCSLYSPSPLCVYLPFLYLFTCVSSFDGSFRYPSPSSHPASHLSLISPPRWITAQRTVQQTQVPIMSLQRERCCLSQARPSKVKITARAILYGIFSKNTSPRLRLK